MMYTTRSLTDFSAAWPRRAGLAMSLEAYARALSHPGLGLGPHKPEDVKHAWLAWGRIFLGVPMRGAVPIPGFAPADVIERDDV